MATATLPLSGIRVLEIGTHLAAPLVGTHLAKLGATVTATTHFSKDYSSSAAYLPPAVTAALQESKALLTIDLETASGQAALLSEIRRSDVVLTNVTHEAERLNFCAERCRALRDRIVHCTLPGFASSGGEGEQSFVHEAIVMAEAGVFVDMGVNRQLMGIKASYSPLPLASTFASVHAALAIVSALHAGRGASIEVPRASACLDTLVHNSIEMNVPKRFQSRRVRALREKDISPRGIDYTEVDYEDVQDLRDPFYAHYFCADGRPFYIVAPSHLRHQQRAIKVLGVEREIQRIGVPICAPYSSGKDGDFGLGGSQIGDEYAGPVRKVLRRAFLRRTAYEWEGLMGDAGVPGAAHRTTTEWLRCEHALAAGLSSISEDGLSVIPGPVAWVQEHGPRDKPSSPSSESASMQKFHDLRQQLSQSSTIDAIFGTKTQQGWLSGIKVLDFANVIAGPTIGAMLARFGAQVLKVDAPNPTYAPDITTLYGLAANCGKKSVLINAKDGLNDKAAPGESGRRAIEALIRLADVVVVNCTMDCLERLRLTPNDLAKINDRIVLVRFDAWGGPNEGAGGRSQHLGYDDNVQAALGIMERFGGGLGRIEEHAHIGTIDVVAGVGGALAAAAALLHRKRRDEAAAAAGTRRQNGILVARTSLAALGQIIQFPFCCGNFKELEASARASISRAGRGPEALLRCYETMDGNYLMLAASFCFHDEVAMKKLASAHPLLDSAVGTIVATLPESGDYDALEVDLALKDALVSTFLMRRAEDWVITLGNAGIPASRLKSMAELRSKYNVGSNVDVGMSTGQTFQFAQDNSHPIGGAVSMFAPCAVRTTDPGADLAPLPLSAAPSYGLHTKEVLRSLGFDASKMLQRGAIASSWSGEYMPGYGNAPLAKPFKKASCPVCLSPTEDPVELACSHSLCSNCAAECAGADLRGCPVCRHPHLLDPVLLAQRSEEWRRKYQGWRDGGAKGAGGEVSSIAVPSLYEQLQVQNENHTENPTSFFAGMLFVHARSDPK